MNYKQDIIQKFEEEFPELYIQRDGYWVMASDRVRVKLKELLSESELKEAHKNLTFRDNDGWI